MKCPACGKEIDKVEITIQERLEGKLKGNRIVDQEPLGYIDDSTTMRCPKCHIDISFAVEEKEMRTK